MALEEMSSFFTNRVEGYDEHMLNEVEGCREGYEKMARLIPESAETLLDLGCGTGLELDEIFKRFPDLKVTGIDMTQAMLEKLKEKHTGRALTLIHASYLEQELGINRFDTAVSFETLHHLAYGDKLALYARLFRALKPDGVYIECDYMAQDQRTEDSLRAENERLRSEMSTVENVIYHFDIPFTLDNQIGMLLKAGFKKVEKVWQNGNTVLLTAQKND
jgi:ubiquinone/menaquinone biosynthesis C-methylase UbiE